MKTEKSNAENSCSRDLLFCPFCGEEPELKIASDVNLRFVLCGNIHCIGPCTPLGTVAEVTRWWNMRVK